jgi:hypothetical protein
MGDGDDDDDGDVIVGIVWLDLGTSYIGKFSASFLENLEISF